jgi:hypothetical protein
MARYPRMFRSAVGSSFLILTLLLTGCALTDTAAPVEERGLSMQGRVRGGQQPVVGAHVYLLAANTTGYPTATAGVSKSLMKFVAGKTLLDISSGPTNGFYYVTTDTSGSFSISNDYTCTSGQQVYLYAVGGDPGAGANSAAGFLATLGNCPSADNFATAVPFVFIDEVTTVASAYAMSGFAYDALHVSSPNSTLSKRNIQNAFANANNIVDITSGTAYATLPAGNGTGAPNTLNTIANVLAACIDTDGPSSTNCQTLFTLAKTNGSTGTAPTDTATAAINIAHNQGTNVAALFSLLGTTQAFQPSYSTAPADFCLPIHFTSPELGTVNGVAMDSLGDVWLATAKNSGISTSVNGFSQFSPQGVHLTTVTDDTNLPSFLQNLEVTAEGDVWGTIGSNFVEYVPGNSSVSSSVRSFSIVDFGEFNGSLHYIGFQGSDYFDGTYAPGTGDTGTGFLAVDGLGRFWATNHTSGTLTGWDSDGTRLTPAAAGYSVGSAPNAIAIDQNNNIWVGSSPTSSGLNAQVAQLLKLNSSGTVLATFNDTSNSLGGSVYVDGANNIWFFVTGSPNETFLEFDSQGNHLQTFDRISSSGNPHNVALDGSGNTWMAAGSGVYQLIGLTTPVVTPIAANLVSPYTTPASKPQ